MAGIWTGVTALSILYGIVAGQGGVVASEILESGGEAVTLVLTMLGTMILWSGLMEILDACGDLGRAGRLLRRLARPLFPELQDEGCWSAMSMNLAANLMGLGNAATPSGIEAAKRLAEQGSVGRRALAMLLVLNTTGLQLLPTTVITLRQAAGSSDPASILLPTLAVSFASTACGVLIMTVVQRGERRRERTFRDDHGECGRSDSAQGRLVQDGCVRSISQGR